MIRIMGFSFLKEDLKENLQDIKIENLHTVTV